MRPKANYVATWSPYMRIWPLPSASLSAFSSSYLTKISKTYFTGGQLALRLGILGRWATQRCAMRSSILFLQCEARHVNYVDGIILHLIRPRRPSGLCSLVFRWDGFLDGVGTLICRSWNSFDNMRPFLSTIVYPHLVRRSGPRWHCYGYHGPRSDMQYLITSLAADRVPGFPLQCYIHGRTDDHAQPLAPTSHVERSDPLSHHDHTVTDATHVVAPDNVL